MEDQQVAKKAKSSDTVTIERRAQKDRRRSSERRKKDQPVKVERRQIQRREKVNRRRQIDPTTCERDYTPDEVEFMQAMDWAVESGLTNLDPRSVAVYNFYAREQNKKARIRQ